MFDADSRATQPNLANFEGFGQRRLVRWRFAAEESEILASLLDAFRATPTERRELQLFARDRARSPTTDSELSYDYRGAPAASRVGFVRGWRATRKRAELARRAGEVLRIPDVEARGILKRPKIVRVAMLNVLAARPDVLPGAGSCGSRWCCSVFFRHWFSALSAGRAP